MAVNPKLASTNVVRALPRQRKLYEADIVAMELERVRTHIPLLFNRDDVFYKKIGQHGGGGRRRQGRRVHSVERG
jgi:hypothetical protein